MKRDRFQCTYCGVPGTDAELEVDHIIAVAKGGSHHMSNLTTACRKCNQSKSDGDAPPRLASSNRDGLIGLWIHTHEPDGSGVVWQGQIVGIDGEMTLVQLYSWLTGAATEVASITRDRIYSVECSLYGDNDQMNLAYERICRRSRRN